MSTNLSTKPIGSKGPKGDHLKCRKGWFHYYRVTPKRFLDVEPKRFHCFSLHTTDLIEARAKSTAITRDLNRQWDDAKQRGESLAGKDLLAKYRAASDVQLKRGFQPKQTFELTDDDLLARLRALLIGDLPTSANEKKAVLGMVEEPKLTLDKAFERFWEYIRDEWSRLSHDQVRTKRNVYLKSIKNFKSVNGDVALYDIERSHSLAFRSWWQLRIEKEGLKADTANRELNSMRRLLNLNFDMDSSGQSNPFQRVSIKPEADVSRIPLTTEQIQKILRSDAVAGLHKDFQILVPLLVNTGMRPVEAIGLELDDVILDHVTPHVHVRRNAIRGLKTSHSERLLPLVGVSLVAAKSLVDQEGWGKRAGKNMYATSVINRAFRKGGLVTDKRQSLYSLRHWFQDQLTKADVVDRAQAQLMGHKFNRPRYGYGKDLSELKDIIEKFAIR